MDPLTAISQVGAVATTLRSVVDAIKGKGSDEKSSSSSSSEGFRTALANYLKLYDKNGDGVLSRSEFTGDPRVFSKSDANSDGRLDARELASMLSASNSSTGGSK